METYEKQLSWRVKQIHIGKNSTAYRAYENAFPKYYRQRGQPQTPDPYDARMSKRQFEGRIRAWKRALHDFVVTDRPACKSLTHEKIKCNLFVHDHEMLPLSHLRGLDRVEIVPSWHKTV
jgi:hypothetical protein